MRVHQFVAPLPQFLELIHQIVECCLACRIGVLSQIDKAGEQHICGPESLVVRKLVNKDEYRLAVSVVQQLKEFSDRIFKMLEVDYESAELVVGGRM